MTKRNDKFVKVFTKILSDVWWKGLKPNARYFFLYLLIRAKAGDDNGTIVVKMQELCAETALNCRTVGRIIAKIQSDRRIEITHHDNSVYEIVICKYKEYQTAQGFTSEPDCKNTTKTPQGAGSYNNELLTLRPDQTRPEQITSETVLESFDAWIGAHVEDLRGTADISYGHLGGRSYVNRMIEEMRAHLGLRYADYGLWCSSGDWRKFVDRWLRNGLKEARTA